MNLTQCLKAAIRYVDDKPSAVPYLTFTPATATWGFYDGALINDVWAIHNDPLTIRVMLLEPQAMVASLAATPWDAFESAITRYATFAVTRPPFVGLHNFIEVPPPKSLQTTPTDDNGQAVN